MTFSIQSQLVLAIVGVAMMSLWQPVASHGYLHTPPGRASMWRFGYNTPVNYDDNAMYCGGFQHQVANGYKCGVCGDAWDLPTPRPNEAGGRFATGTIAGKFTQGQETTITATITANHKGWFEFKLCPTNDYKKAATQECLDQHVLQLADGSGSKLYVGEYGNANVDVSVKLPEDLTCDFCVLQWRYHAGNSWGKDPDGKGCVGCGQQEEFYGCADIKIAPKETQGPASTHKPPTTTKNPTTTSSTSRPSTTPDRSTASPSTSVPRKTTPKSSSAKPLDTSTTQMPSETTSSKTSFAKPLVTSTTQMPSETTSSKTSSAKPLVTSTTQMQSETTSSKTSSAKPSVTSTTQKPSSKPSSTKPSAPPRSSSKLQTTPSQPSTAMPPTQPKNSGTTPDSTDSQKNPTKTTKSPNSPTSTSGHVTSSPTKIPSVSPKSSNPDADVTVLMCSPRRAKITSEWCNVNCNTNHCIPSLCQCETVVEPRLNGTLAPGCYAKTPFAHLPNMDTWCSNDCFLKVCNNNRCFCV